MTTKARSVTLMAGVQVSREPGIGLAELGGIAALDGQGDGFHRFLGVAAINSAIFVFLYIGQTRTILSNDSSSSCSSYAA